MEEWIIVDQFGNQIAGPFYQRWFAEQELERYKYFHPSAYVERKI